MVANEVKNLANQTTSAADNISNLVDNVQSLSGDVIDALKKIKGSAVENRQYLTEIVQMVGVQRENSDTASDRATIISASVADLNDSFNKVNEATSDSGKAANTLQETSEHAQTLISEISGIIDDFITKTKSAT